MIRKPIQTHTKIILSIASCVLLAGIYFWLSHKQHVFNPKDTTIPNASQLLDGVLKITTPDDSKEIWLWEDFKATFLRHIGGMVVGTLMAFVVGMSMGVWKPAESFFYPPISLLAKIPPTAMMAVYFVMVGTGYNMFVAMIALGIFPTLTQAIYNAAKNDVPDTLIYKAYTLGASHFETIWYVVFKQILPRIIESVRLQIGPALVFLIAAEMLISDVGFGYRLRIQSRLLSMNTVYLYLLFLGVAFYAMDYSLIKLRSKLCPWFGMVR